MKGLTSSRATHRLVRVTYIKKKVLSSVSGLSQVEPTPCMLVYSWKEKGRAQSPSGPPGQSLLCGISCWPKMARSVPCLGRFTHGTGRRGRKVRAKAGMGATSNY